ncbi:unnamed protein product [Cuscuta epithymum]|nr:unnamed protein product [Cuscuta epithymum]
MGDMYCPCSFSHSKTPKKSLECDFLDLMVSRMFLERLKFINTSNGLILCKSDRYEQKYLVLNPITKRSVTLPPPPYSRSAGSIGLMCEENKNQLSAKYTVVRTAGEGEKGTMQIVTYSSETGVWVAAKLPVIAAAAAKEDIYFYLFRDPPLVMNGVFHWYQCTTTPTRGGSMLGLWWAEAQGKVKNNYFFKVLFLKNSIQPTPNFSITQSNFSA